MSSDAPPTPHHRLPAFVPGAARKRLANWHPGRSRRWRRLPGVQRVNGMQAVLTFDDGPGLDATPEVLGELARAGAPATFFVLGREVQRQPELARQIAAQGHEIALHGFDHLRHDRISALEARRDIETSLEAVEHVTGLRPVWFRPPFGRISRGSYDGCRALGLHVAYWSGWGLDWEETPPERIVAEVGGSLQPGKHRAPARHGAIWASNHRERNRTSRGSDRRARAKSRSDLAHAGRGDKWQLRLVDGLGPCWCAPPEDT